MKSRFNRLFKLIMQQYGSSLDSFSDIITVTPLAQWQSPNMAFRIQQSWKRQYNVDAEFHDGGDQNSRWYLTGTKRNIKRLLRNQFATSLDGTDYETILDDPRQVELLRDNYEQIMSINILTQQFNNEDAMMLKTVLERKYNIDAEFHKNENQQASWYLVGDKKDLKRALKKEFNLITPKDIQNAFTGNYEKMKQLFMEQIQENIL